MNVKKIIKIQALYRAIKARKHFEVLNMQNKVIDCVKLKEISRSRVNTSQKKKQEKPYMESTNLMPR
jgi:hypothetical protein